MERVLPVAARVPREEIVELDRPRAVDVQERRGALALAGREVPAQALAELRELRGAQPAVVVGATYDGWTDTLVRPASAQVDSLVAYERAIAAAEVRAISLDVPCAKLYEGAGYAFFPGVGGGESGGHSQKESLVLSNLKCNAGPHVVRFRHLTSAANDAELTVDGKAVLFNEPEGFDEDVVDHWAMTAPVILDLKANTDQIGRAHV